jgi:hypothetical protein
MAMTGFLFRVADKVLTVMHPGVIALNDGEWTGETRPAMKIAESLQKNCLALQGTFIHEDGRGVNYKDIGASDMFKEYAHNTAELRNADLSSLTLPEKMAFWMDTYNMLTIHTLVMQGPEVTLVCQIPRFWRRFGYVISSQFFSLDDIEHGILRANRPHPMTRDCMLPKDDDRLTLSLKDEEVDPRIHFALVCGARSCPPIRVFTPKNLEFGLKAAAKNFLSDITVEGNKITMSKILDWYAVDFGVTKAERLAKIIEVMGDGENKAALQALLESGNFEFAFRPYDWNLNHDQHG